MHSFKSERVFGTRLEKLMGNIQGGFMKFLVPMLSAFFIFTACSSAPEKLEDRRASINEEYQEDLADLKEEREESLKEAEEEYQDDVREYRRERAHEAIDDSDKVEYDEDGNVINLQN